MNFVDIVSTSLLLDALPPLSVLRTATILSFLKFFTVSLALTVLRLGVYQEALHCK